MLFFGKMEFWIAIIPERICPYITIVRGKKDENVYNSFSRI